jgi:phosphate butyryltransferase
MIQQFLSQLNHHQTHTIAVACAHDEDVLSAIIQAKDAGIANAILVGKQELIQSILKDLHSNHEFLIIDEPNNEQAVKICIDCVKQSKANMLMKGLVDTSVLLKQVVSTQDGLKASPVLAHVAVVKVPTIGRMLIMSDGAMNILPSLEQKVHILNHCVEVAKALQFDPIRVGVICAVEKVNPKMQCTLDALELKSMNESGLIKDCVVDGPYALDNALSIEAAEHKGMTSAHVGLSNVLLLPNIESGNVLYKAVTYLAQGETAGVIMGASVPIVVTSRSDSDKNKLNSIALAALIAQSNTI